MAKELIMYTRTSGCPFVSVAKRVLADHDVTYREINIDQDAAARDRVKAWTGFLSVPTLVVTSPGATVPDEAVTPLAVGSSPRGIDRGPMITEPGAEQLLTWLAKHGFTAVNDDAPAQQEDV